MIELIPAIDIIDGKCVRLTQGDYATKKVYNEDPLEVAKMFEGNGIRRLHVVDLDGAREGRIINYRILERIATRTSLIIDFGGGLKQEDDLEIAFESGEPLPADGVFIAYGTAGSADFARKLGAQLENGRIQTDAGMATAVPGLFAPSAVGRKRPAKS